jgi:hypothetical protein
MKGKVLFVVFSVSAWSTIAFGQAPDPLYSVEWPVVCGTEITDWTILKGEWMCTVEGVEFSDSKGTIIATPAFDGCDSCTIVNGYFLNSGRISFLGWYQDQNNFVKLTARRLKSGLVKWKLTQVVSGSIVAKASGEQQASGDFHETAAVGFDGQTFSVVINETPTPLFQMEKEPGTAPIGTIGYQHKKANGGYGATIVYPGIFFPQLNELN